MCEKYIDWLPLLHPQLGTWPLTHACVLSGDRTRNLSVCRQTLSPLSHTSQGPLGVYLKEFLPFTCLGVGLPGDRFCKCAASLVLLYSFTECLCKFTLLLAACESACCLHLLQHMVLPGFSVFAILVGV